MTPINKHIEAIAAIVGTNYVNNDVNSPSKAAPTTLEPPFRDLRNAIVVRPGGADEVAELVRLATTRGLVVVPFGSGTRMSPLPQTACTLLLDLSRLRHVVSLDETSLLVHVQAGLTAVELETILSRRGLSIGDFPPASLSSSIGGLLAVRTPGKTSTRHGFMEDIVLGVSAVLADGRTIHTRIAPRRATGPDITRAICGSEGTLGIITSAVLRIHRQPESRFTAAFKLPSISDALAAVRIALREEATPASMQISDCEQSRFDHGDAVCADDEAILLVATAGPTDLAACDRELVASAVIAQGGQRIDDEFADRWWTGRNQVQHLHNRAHLEVSATPGKLLEIYQRVSAAALAAGKTIRTHISRFNLDGGVIFFTLARSNTDLERCSADVTAKLLPELTSTASLAGAYLLGQWNPILAPYFETLRESLDPDSILNPEIG